jgi:hypothetical protein
MRVIETRYVWFACLLSFFAGLPFRQFVSAIWTRDAQPAQYLPHLALSAAMAVVAIEFVRRRRKHLRG